MEDAQKIRPSKQRNRFLIFLCLGILSYFALVVTVQKIVIPGYAPIAVCPLASELGMDFVHGHVAAKSFLAGHSMYQNNAQYGPEFTDPFYFPPTRFIYPPSSVFLFLPATLADWKTAYYVWAALQLLILGGITWLTTRWLDFSRPAAAISCLAVCLSYPVFFSVERGNFDTAIFLLYWAGICAWIKKKSTWLSGSLIGAACAIKLFPVMIAGYLFVRKDFTAWARCTICAAVITLVCAGHLFADFVDALVQVSEHMGHTSLAVFNHSLSRFSFRFAASIGKISQANLQLARLLSTAAALTMLTAMSVAVWRWQNQHATLKRLEVAAFILLMSIIPSISYDYKLIFIAFLLPICAEGIWAAWAAGHRIAPIAATVSLAHLFVPSWQGFDGNIGILTLLWASKTPAIVCLIAALMTIIHQLRQTDDFRPAPEVHADASL